MKYSEKQEKLLKAIVALMGILMLVATLTLQVADGETAVAEAEVVRSIENVSPIHYFTIYYRYNVNNIDYDKMVVVDGWRAKAGDKFDVEYYLQNPAQEKRNFILGYILSITLCTYSAFMFVDDIFYKMTSNKRKQR